MSTFSTTTGWILRPPLEETMGALDYAVKSGKALYAVFRITMVPLWKKPPKSCLICAVRLSSIKTAILSLSAESERNGLKDSALKLGKGIIAFSPLAQGLLTDRYLNGIPKDSRIRTDGRFLKESALTDERLSRYGL